MGWKFKGVTKEKRESRVCVEGLLEREKGEMYRYRLREFCDSIEQVGYGEDIEGMWSEVRDGMNEAAERVFVKKEMKSKKGKGSPWFSQD